MPTPSASLLEKLKLQREKLDARIQKTEALNKNHERKKETRRKILVGSYYLDQAEKNGSLNELKKLLSDYLTRDSDRALFELPEKMKVDDIQEKTEGKENEAAE